MPKRNLIWALAIAAAAVAATWVARGPQHTIPRDSDELAPVTDVYRLIERNYYRPADGDALRRGAVKGMVESLDEFSSYVPRGQAASFAQRIAPFARVGSTHPDGGCAPRKALRIVRLGR